MRRKHLTEEATASGPPAQAKPGIVTGGFGVLPTDAFRVNRPFTGHSLGTGLLLEKEVQVDVIPLQSPRALSLGEIPKSLQGERRVHPAAQERDLGQPWSGGFLRNTLPPQRKRLACLA